MDKNQISQGAHASVLTTRNRQIFWARFFLLAMLFVLGLTSFQPQTAAQAADQAVQRNKTNVTISQPSASAPNCPDQCEQALVECLASGGGAASCGKQYDVCLTGCQ
jgi:hypothetical protein